MNLTQKQTVSKRFLHLLSLYRQACSAPDSKQKRDRIVKLSEELESMRPQVSPRLWALTKEH